MAIKIEMLRCFVAVAEHGNLNDAANRLGRTPSAVSMSLKQLTDHLGAPLFESDRKNRLTTLGQLVLTEARAGTAQFDRCIDSIVQMTQARSGIVRVGAVPSVTTAILPDVVQTFVHDRPDVVIQVRDMDSGTVQREVELGRIDIGIGSCRGPTGALRRVVLFSEPFGVICAVDHPLATATAPLSWEELAKVPVISNASGDVIENAAFRAIDEAANLRIRNTASVLGMVRAGVGVTVLPRLAIEGLGPGLVFVALADPTARRHVEIMTRAQSEMVPVASAFEKAVIEGIERAKREDRIIPS
ncbi:LysR family transcriptional regulator [Mameliella alba]|uniref:Transcriptional regulator, LysR family n=1 Tax=Mameliella alba TaxID=561184 RepID=A0A0B3SK96_9RHOB|nr:LysR family transcriptional regulator [Mameliella alba]KHQ50939.1 Transcriptional regulator, LysR family [Mameliella alba]